MIFNLRLQKNISTMKLILSLALVVIFIFLAGCDEKKLENNETSLTGIVQVSKEIQRDSQRYRLLAKEIAEKSGIRRINLPLSKDFFTIIQGNEVIEGYLSQKTKSIINGKIVSNGLYGVREFNQIDKKLSQKWVDYLILNRIYGFAKNGERIIINIKPDIYVVILLDDIDHSQWSTTIGEWSKPDYRGDVYIRIEKDFIIATSRR